MSAEGKTARPGAASEDGGCLAAVVRVPVRIVVLVVVVPLRLLWDLLVAMGRGFRRHLLEPLRPALRWLGQRVLAPIGRGLVHLLRFLGKLIFVWPWVGLWRYFLVPLSTYGIAAPLIWIYREVLTRLGRLTVPLLRYALLIPLQWIYVWVLTPIGQGSSWLLRACWRGLLWTLFHLVARPVVWLAQQVIGPLFSLLWRYVLAPVLRGLASAASFAWKVAGYISRAIGGALFWCYATFVAPPARWCYRTLFTPVGHLVRDLLWRPARTTAAEAGRAARSALRSARETVRRMTGSTRRAPRKRRR
ncbi:hypothetical protein [Streptomyces albipurpureus]|uniref:Integral membrane protein n=1 Tax=Streptomyces albipurpureus TaxID=2897419 RepID=A0ABT0V1K7_9ACTN|nr:hypothetical protein [Streptomyces sp. CWNU-1]MCM2393281.1 hypothetical protein [Streptomyces sp. CWNU-1]